MTEAEWLVCEEPLKMLKAVPGGLQHARHPDPRIRRKRELFGAACCRLIWPEMVDERSRRCVEYLERQFDEESGLPSEQVRAIFKAAEAVTRAPHSSSSESQREAASAAYAACEPAYVTDCLLHIDTAKGETTLSRQVAHLLREIIGNPSRPVAFLADWRTQKVVELATQIYDTRDFTKMPRLAEALADAGCEDEAILSHCRGAGPHVRGCWCLDGLLGVH